MKNLLVFLISFIFINEAISGGGDDGQDESSSEIMITYDFRSGKFSPSLKFVKPGQMVRLRVINVNTAIYKYEINGSSQSFNDNIPSSFSTLVLGIEKEKEESEDVKVAPEGFTQTKDIGAKKLTEAEADSLKKLEEKRKEVEKKRQEKKLLIEKIEDGLKEIASLKDFHSEIKSLLLSNNISADNVVSEKKTLWNLRTAGLELKNCNAGCAIKLQKNGEALVSSAISDMEKYIKLIESEQSLLMNESVLKENNSVIASLTTIKAFDFKKLISEIGEIYDVLNENLFITEIDEFIEVERNNDQITIKAKGAFQEGVKPLGRKIPVSFEKSWCVTGWKIDFSTGLIITSLRDEQYAAKLRPDVDSTYQVINESNGKSEIGLGALTHISYRFNCLLAAGFNTGVALGTEQKPRYLLGLSFIAGRKQRLIINSGLSYGKRGKLSRTIDPPTDFLNEPDDIKMREVEEIGWYFGISYNLGK